MLEMHDLGELESLDPCDDIGDSGHDEGTKLPCCILLSGVKIMMILICWIHS